MLTELIQAFATGDSESLKWAVASLLLCLPIVILALSVHETAHGLVANKLGDPTAKNMGRLTLNPLKHLDPIGFLCMVAFGFGWAKPVPVNSRYFKKPRCDMMLTAIAGPASNLILALIFTALLKIFSLVTPLISITSQLTFNILMFVNILISLGVQLNITLAVFNLIPVPPLDGSKILYMFLPPKAYYKILQYERYIYIALLVLLALGVLDPVISGMTGLIQRLFYLIFFIPVG